MDQAIHGVNSFLNKLTLSNHSLTSQILIINLLTAIIGLFFLIIFNFFLILNDNSIEIKNIENKKKLNRISNYLKDNSILRVPLFNEKCEENINSNLKECEDIVLSDPQLDPTLTQQYIVQNYLNEDIVIKVFDDSWIKYADTLDIYKSSEDVVEVDIENKEIKSNYYTNYRDFYLGIFYKIKQFFIKKKLQPNLINYMGDVSIVKETIKKKSNGISNLYLDQENTIISILSQSIVKNQKVYGVVLVTFSVSQNNTQLALTSFNLINLYFIIIIIMFLSSIFFSRSLVAPIKLLSRITRSEREKLSNNHIDNLYPRRKDEIGVLGNDIRSMSEDLKKRIAEIESFAADVSHELKNPLSSINSSNELLYLNKISDKQKFLLLKNMKQDIERMNILITDISSYTLTQVEIEEEVFEKFDFIFFLNEFLKLYLNNKQKIIIDFNCESLSAIILANKNKLAQVLHNIIDNSLSYAPFESNIFIKQKIVDKDLIINIVDQGNGIPIKLAEKIFDRFYTDRPKDRDKHSGLGLSIARKTIETFGGSIILTKSSYPSHQGACFEIKLPLKD